MNTAFLGNCGCMASGLAVMLLNRTAELKGYTIVVAASLPLVLIVNGLALFGVEHAVYGNMVGDHDPNGPGKHGADAFVNLISLASAVLAPAILASYARIGRRVRAGKKSIGVSRGVGHVVRAVLTE